MTENLLSVLAAEPSPNGHGPNLADSDTLDAFAELGRGEPCERMKALRGQYLAELVPAVRSEGSYGAMTKATQSIVSRMAEGHPGGNAVLTDIRDAYYRCPRHPAEELARCYRRAVHGAMGTAEIFADTDPCDDFKSDFRPPLNGTWLDAQAFPPLCELIPGVLAEGLTVLAGAPKAGKSVLALQIALAVSGGGGVLGVACERAPVLYLDLEDSAARLQLRCRELGNGGIPELFEFKLEITAEDVAPYLGWWLGRQSSRALVIIDTINKRQGPPKKGETVYDRDYRLTGNIHRITKERPGTSIVAITHTRKAEHDDFLSRVTGTHGVTGAADTVYVLARKRRESEGTLSRTSRDMDDAEWEMLLGRPRGWELAGGTFEAAERQAELRSSRLEERMLDIISAVWRNPDGISTARVAELTGMPAKSASMYLSRAVSGGYLIRTRRGFFAPDRAGKLDFGSRA